MAALAEAEEGLGESKEAEEHAQRALSREAGQPIAAKYLELYRQTLRKTDERVRGLRGRTGAPSEGTRP